MSSLEELYLLPSWDDSIVELIKERMSVHELTSIPVNEINSNDLKILFPEINDMQVEEFFKHRDGDTDKKIKASKFKNADDFKNIVVSKLNIISDSEYKKRLAELKNAGLVIDVASKLYKISSKGTYNNASYTLVAIVDIPLKEAAPKKTDAKNPNTATSNENKNEDSNENPDDVENPKENEGQGEGKDSKDKSPPLEFLNPRVVEIRPE
jgi:ribosomal protein L15